MKRKQPISPQKQSLGADVHPDDGLDPRTSFGPARRPGRSRSSRPSDRGKAFGRKTLQLCSQVADTLNLVLSGECGDELLQCLQVVAVTPAPDASQLLVVVSPSLAESAPDPRIVLEHLAAANGRLRSAVAATITRRRAPKLIFQYVGPPPTTADPPSLTMR